MGRKAILLILMLVVLFSQACAEETAEAASKAPEKQPVETYNTLDDALKSGKPVFCLFYTLQACHCTVERCNTALALCDSLVKPMREDIIYFAWDVSGDRATTRQYKLMALPTAVFFDEKGAEVARLQSWEIKEKNILEKIAQLTTKDKKDRK